MKNLTGSAYGDFSLLETPERFLVMKMQGKSKQIKKVSVSGKGIMVNATGAKRIRVQELLSLKMFRKKHLV